MIKSRKFFYNRNRHREKSLPLIIQLKIIIQYIYIYIYMSKILIRSMMIHFEEQLNASSFKNTIKTQKKHLKRLFFF